MKKSSFEKIHSWRACPVGEHLVREHPYHMPPSKTHPNGLLTKRHQHCAKNPSGKDILSFDEV